MLLLVGLGNPGPRHAKNRHNIGFMAVDEIVRRHGFGPWRARFRGRIAEGRIADEKVLALEPETYMNESGRAVGEAVRFYKLEPETQVIVIYDEIDLKPGKVRVKLGGGAAAPPAAEPCDAAAGPLNRRAAVDCPRAVAACGAVARYRGGFRVLPLCRTTSQCRPLPHGRCGQSDARTFPGPASGRS